MAKAKTNAKIVEGLTEAVEQLTDAVEALSEDDTEGTADVASEEVTAASEEPATAEEAPATAEEIKEHGFETITNPETGKEEILVTAENAAEVAKFMSDEFAEAPVPFEAPKELTLGGEVYVFDANEFQSHLKETLQNVLARSQMPKEFYNGKFKVKTELQKLIDSL